MVLARRRQTGQEGGRSPSASHPPVAPPTAPPPPPPPPSPGLDVQAGLAAALLAGASVRDGRLLVGRPQIPPGSVRGARCERPGGPGAGPPHPAHGAPPAGTRVDFRYPLRLAALES